MKGKLDMKTRTIALLEENIKYFHDLKIQGLIMVMSNTIITNY